MRATAAFVLSKATKPHYMLGATAGSGRADARGSRLCAFDPRSDDRGHRARRGGRIGVTIRVRAWFGRALPQPRP